MALLRQKHPTVYSLKETEFQFSYLNVNAIMLGYIKGQYVAMKEILQQNRR